MKCKKCRSISEAAVVIGYGLWAEGLNQEWKCRDHKENKMEVK